MRNRKLLAKSAAALAFAGLAFGVTPALANGGAFFADMVAEGLYDPDAGVPFFGFIKDNNGRMIPNALVTLTVAGGDLSVAARADKMGHYRIPGFAKSVDPKNVDITCSKVGFRQIASQRRVLRGNANAPIQVDCTLASAKVASN